MLAHILNSINDFFWDIPFLTFIVGIGLYFFIKSRLFPVVHFGHILRHTVFSSKKNRRQKKKGPYLPLKPFVSLLAAVSALAVSAVLPLPWLLVDLELCSGCGSGPSVV